MLAINECICDDARCINFGFLVMLYIERKVAGGITSGIISARSDDDVYNIDYIDYLFL